MENINRRRLLECLGIGAGTLYLPSLMGDRLAYGQAAPKRFVLYYNNHGPADTRWQMTRPGLPPLTGDWEFPLDDPDPNSFSKTLRPLHAVRGDISIIDGLAYTPILSVDSLQSDPHAASGKVRFNGGTGANATSFDQFIAEHVAVPGRFKYLAYANTASDIGFGSRDVAGNSVTASQLANGHLADAFKRLFGTLGTGTQPTGPLTPADLSRKHRSKALAFAGNEYTKLMTKLGADDRAKLVTHRDLLADLSRRVVTLTEIKCAKPATPNPGNNYRMIADATLSQLFPVAMACDLSRVGIFVEPDLRPEDYGAPSGTDPHGSTAHGGFKDPQAAQLESYMAVHAKHFANMVAAFKAVPEGNGTMLDNSVLLWMTELGSGWHQLNRQMFVMAGKGGGAFHPGRYIKYSENSPNPSGRVGNYNTPADAIVKSANSGSSKYGIGPAYNKLLVSIMQAMGVARNSIGLEKATGRGFMSGANIDLTGPLPRL